MNEEGMRKRLVELERQLANRPRSAKRREEWTLKDYEDDLADVMAGRSPTPYAH